MVVDAEGKELEKVECPRKCMDEILKGSEKRVKKIAPGQTHTTYSVCSVCHGSGWIWRRKEELKRKSIKK